MLQKSNRSIVNGDDVLNTMHDIVFLFIIKNRKTYINKNYGNLLMVSPHGLEPWTHRLRVCCSTN